MGGATTIEGKVPSAPPLAVLSSTASPRAVVLLSQPHASCLDPRNRRRPSPSLSRISLRCPSLFIHPSVSFRAPHGARPLSFRCVGCSCGLCCRYRDTDPYLKPWAACSAFLRVPARTYAPGRYAWPVSIRLPMTHRPYGMQMRVRRLE